MNSPRSRPDAKNVVDIDDTYPTQATVPAGGNAVVCDILCPGGLKPILKKIGNVVNDGTGGSYITWSLLVNGAAWPRLNAIANELSDPAKPEDYLPYEDSFGSSAHVQLVAYNSDGAKSHTVVGRLVIWYEDRNAQNN